MNRRGVILCFHPMVNGLCSALLNDFNLAGSVGTTLEDTLVVLHKNARRHLCNGYLDLKQDGPTVIEAPPGLQGIMDDFWQRPICSEGKIEGHVWCGDVGLPGPDHGKGGKYLILPPDFKGAPPADYFTMRSRTYGVFVFWRGFFKSPKDLAPPVNVMEETRLYPLEKREGAKPMQFPGMCPPTCYFRRTGLHSIC